MKKNKQPNILLVLGWYFEEIHRGVAQYAREQGWRLTAAFPNQPVNLSYWDGDGIISSLNRSTPEYDFVCKSKLPVVELTETHPELPFSRVLLNNFEVGQMGADYFLSKGFQNFAFIGTGKNMPTLDREKGFRAKIAASGFSMRSFYFSDHGPEREKCWEAAATFVKNLPSPTAILTAFEVTGAAINTICENEGIKIPDQVALLCCGNHELTCGWTPTPMSGIAMPLIEQGYKAAELLDEMLTSRDKSATITRLSPVKIVERQSTQILAVANEAVAKAIGFIRENSLSSLKVADVAYNSGVSRRYLERAFKSHLNKTVNQFIIEERIERVKEYLSRNELPTKAIAYELGFSSVQYLHKQFSKLTGITIKEFKAGHGKQKTRFF